MDIYQLEYFLAVARYQHFSHAADEICVSQSTLSHQINKLEDELDVKLFKRTTRSVYLTPAGNEFLTYATRITNEINRAKMVMRQYLTAERGKIVIGAIPTIGLLKLTTVIASFQKIHTNINIDIQEDFSGRLLEMLLSSEIDVALMTPPHDLDIYSNINFYPLITDEIVLTVCTDNPLSANKTIHLNDAKNENYIIMIPNNGLRAIALEACRNAGFEPKVVFQSRQVETVIGLVSEGLGVALITSRIARFLKNPNFNIIKIHDAPKRVTALAVCKQNYTSPTIHQFCSFILAQKNL